MTNYLLNIINPYAALYKSDGIPFIYLSILVMISTWKKVCFFLLVRKSFLVLFRPVYFCDVFINIILQAHELS